MRYSYKAATMIAATAFGGGLAPALSKGWCQEPAPPVARPRDPAAEAKAVRAVPAERPEQQLTEHDRSDAFDPTKPAPISPALQDQPKQGRITGFDFARDPLNADKPFTTFEEVMEKESAAEADGHGGPAEAAGEPVRPDPEARPAGQDVARQARPLSGRRPGCRRG